MSKLHAPRVIGKDHVENLQLPEEVTVALHELAGAVKDGLLALSVGVGLNVLQLMMDEELNDIVGPKGKHNQDRTATRDMAPRTGASSWVTARSKSPGRAPGTSTTLARSSSPPRSTSPRRTCSADGARAHGRWALDAQLHGWTGAGGRRRRSGTKRSSVSRRFVGRTASALNELMERDLFPLEIVALILDGIEIAGHRMVVALGVDAKGYKHALGLREGTTESKACAGGCCRT